MSDTHTGTVETHSQTSGLMRKVFVPDDWPAGIHVTVVRGHAPEGLAAAGDGTYYGPAWAAAKHDYAARTYDNNGDEWVSPETFSPHQIVQCRPVPDPQPRTERVPWHQALGRKLPHGGTVRELHKDEGLAAWASSPAGDSAREDADGMVEVLVEDDR